MLTWQLILYAGCFHKRYTEKLIAMSSFRIVLPQFEQCLISRSNFVDLPRALAYFRSEKTQNSSLKSVTLFSSFCLHQNILLNSNTPIAIGKKDVIDRRRSYYRNVSIFNCGLNI